MKRSELQQIFAVNVAHLILHINECGYSCTFGEAWRTPEMAAIYAQQGKGIKNSLHCIRLAVDLNLFKDGVYLPNGEAHRPFAEYWESLNTLNRSGIHFGDANHYEMREE